VKVIFAGTPDFARVALEHLLTTGYTVPLVLTQPDRPAGRGMKLQASPVKQCARAHGITVAQPRSLRLDGKYPADAASAQATIVAAAADVMIVAAYGLLLPPWVLAAPRLGCLNIHASLLPRWRGAAPIHRAIEAGDTETGITIMQMDEGLDTGDILCMEKIAITPKDTTATLHDRLATLGARLLQQTLHQADLGKLTATPQAQTGVSYAHKINKEESVIDWHQSAAQIALRVRAFNPFPGTTTTICGETIKVWDCEDHGILCHKKDPPGKVLCADEHSILVACGERTVLRLNQLQRAGGKRLAADAFLRGFAMQEGMVLK